jgi:hypothetical protein
MRTRRPVSYENQALKETVGCIKELPATTCSHARYTAQHKLRIATIVNQLLVNIYTSEQHVQQTAVSYYCVLEQAALDTNDLGLRYIP